MLRQVKKWYKHTVHGEDGELGEIEDFYFEDHTWEIRYLVLATGDWLDGRRVLLAPPALGASHPDRAILPVRLTREQIRQSPPVDMEKPVSRRYETDLFEYYNWPFYWSNLPPSGTATGTPGLAPLSPAQLPAVEAAGDEDEFVNPHLRSMREVIGYHLKARDGDVGRIVDFVVDDERWAIFYMLVSTANWLDLGREVLLAPTWVETIDWSARAVVVDLQRKTIRNSPPFEPADLIDRDYEEKLYGHYGRRAYWKPETPDNS